MSTHPHRPIPVRPLSVADRLARLAETLDNIKEFAEGDDELIRQLGLVETRLDAIATLAKVESQALTQIANGLYNEHECKRIARDAIG